MADTHDKPQPDDKPATPTAPDGEPPAEAAGELGGPWQAAAPPTPADTLTDLLAALPAEPPLPAAEAGTPSAEAALVAEPEAPAEPAPAKATPAPSRTTTTRTPPAKGAKAASAKAKSAKAVPPAKTVPPSKRARHPLVVIGSALMTLVLVAGIAVMAAISYGETVLRRPGPLAADKVVNLSRTPGFRDIGDVLEREGVVENSWLFVGGVMLRQARQELKAGEYLFPRGASVSDVIAIIVGGKSVLHQVTIPEGLTSEQVVARLLENDILSGAIREIPKEGSLLPETYRFSRGITREQILQRMAADHRRVVADIWAKRAGDLPLHTPEQLVILASIVEKETGKASERARVAAVFLNRLQRRMRLQSDPTIIYGLVGGKGSLGRPILRSDIDRPTAYNTYVIDGLPPGPIANPGRAALEATANPLQTKELYFVADGTGGHVFAETLEEHNRNVARWREIERQQNGQATPAPAPAPVPPRPQAPVRSGQ